MRHRLEYFGVRLLIALVRAMPGVAASIDRARSSAAPSTCSIGRTAASPSGTSPRRFPARSTAERRHIVRGAFAHFGRLLMELLKFSTLSPEAMLARVEFEGEEHVRAAHAQGSGVLFVTGHFGYWELQAMVHALRLQPMAVRGARARQPGAERRCSSASARAPATA